MERYSYKQILGELRLWLCNHFINKIPSHTVRLFYYKSIMKFNIGTRSYIHLGCRFNCTSHFSMGNHSVINQYCHIDNRGGIIIGNNVSIAPHVKMITADHDLYTNDCEGRQSPINMMDYVFIGYGAIILGNVVMQEGSALGAYSLLKSDTDPFYLYVGLPAIKSKKRPETLNYKMDYNRLFH